MHIAVGGGADSHSKNHLSGGVGESLDIKPGGRDETGNTWEKYGADPKEYAKIANVAGANRLGVPSDWHGLHVQTSGGAGTGRPTMSWDYGRGTDQEFRASLQKGEFDTEEARAYNQSLYPGTQVAETKPIEPDVVPETKSKSPVLANMSTIPSLGAKKDVQPKEVGPVMGGIEEGFLYTEDQPAQTSVKPKSQAQANISPIPTLKSKAPSNEVKVTSPEKLKNRLSPPMPGLAVAKTPKGVDLYKKSGPLGRTDEVALAAGSGSKNIMGGSIAADQAVATTNMLDRDMPGITVAKVPANAIPYKKGGPLGRTDEVALAAGSKAKNLMGGSIAADQAGAKEMTKKPEPKAPKIAPEAKAKTTPATPAKAETKPTAKGPVAQPKKNQSAGTKTEKPPTPATPLPATERRSSPGDQGEGNAGGGNIDSCWVCDP
jgi:hypothetical protein